MGFMNGNRAFNANLFLNYETLKEDVDKSSLVVNDVENSKAYGPYSVSMGGNNVAGSNAFKIEAVSTSNKTMTLSSVEGLSAGLKCSCIFDRNFDLFGEITSINKSTRKVTFSDIPEDAFSSGDENILWVPEHPELGDGETIVGAAAFVAGGYSKANQDASIALGYDNISGGRFSLTAGQGNFAAYGGVALGSGNKLFKETSVGIGQGNIVYHQVGVGIGRKNHARGQYAVAIGNECVVDPQAGIALGNHAIVEEAGVLALGKLPRSNSRTKVAINNNEGKYYFEVGTVEDNKQHAQNLLGLDANRLNVGVGNNMVENTDPNRFGVAIGNLNTHEGSGSVLIGHKNTATKDAVYGIALGQNLTLQTPYSVLVGEGAKALGSHNISIGRNTKTEGLGSIAMGWENHAKKLFSVVFGKTNISTRQSQFVAGEHNARDDNALFIIGNGENISGVTTPGEFKANDGRSNAFVVHKNGEALCGKATTKSSGDLVLVTKGYLDSLIASLQSQIDSLK